jgi:hypothetical protein
VTEPEVNRPEDIADLQGSYESERVEELGEPKPPRENRDRSVSKSQFTNILLEVTGQGNVRVAECLHCRAIVQRFMTQEHYKWHRKLDQRLG